MKPGARRFESVPIHCVCSSAVERLNVTQEAVGSTPTRHPRGVAQLGSAPDLDSGGRQFESDHPDVNEHLLKLVAIYMWLAAELYCFLSIPVVPQLTTRIILASAGFVSGAVSLLLSWELRHEDKEE